MGQALGYVRQCSSAAGYLLILLLPILLVVGAHTRHTYLAIGVAFLLFPLMRLLFGPYRQAHAIEWHESIASALHALPIVYAGFLFSCLVLVGVSLFGAADLSAVELIGLGLSLWITMLFALCPAHELIHRRTRFERIAGAFVAGATGYPALVLEHPLHHARHADLANAEWPKAAESVWQFSARRLTRIAREFSNELASAISLRHSGQVAQSTLVATLATLGTGTWLTSSMGAKGLFLYLGCAAGCTLGMQLMTYLQHWGLADGLAGSPASTHIAWEEDCRFQAWVTLHISFHQAHHLHAGLPFYRLGMSDSSPRMPAGYILMMIFSMFPRLWQRHMVPLLTFWSSQESAPIGAGHALTCFHIYRLRAVRKKR